MIQAFWLSVCPDLMQGSQLLITIIFRSTSSTFNSLFSTIPPERVGLSGEYDYSGLAKRVAAAFRQQIEAAELLYSNAPWAAINELSGY
jgi:hypothetical protein